MDNLACLAGRVLLIDTMALLWKIHSIGRFISSISGSSHLMNGTMSLSAAFASQQSSMGGLPTTVAGKTGSFVGKDRRLEDGRIRRRSIESRMVAEPQPVIDSSHSTNPRRPLPHRPEP
jgi:hypothetical protein